MRYFLLSLHNFWAPRPSLSEKEPVCTVPAYAYDCLILNQWVSVPKRVVPLQRLRRSLLPPYYPTAQHGLPQGSVSCWACCQHGRIRSSAWSAAGWCGLLPEDKLYPHLPPKPLPISPSPPAMPPPSFHVNIQWCGTSVSFISLPLLSCPKAPSPW